MQRIKNLWFPDGERSGWLEAVQQRDGIPIYQPEALEALINASRHRRLVIDGGAHVGLWTLHLARAFQHVVAFEPNPAAFECLLRNLEDYELVHKVTCFQVALGRWPHEAKLQGSNEKSLSWSLRDRPGLDTLSVGVTALDREIFGSDKEILGSVAGVDAIKLDVEGFQYEALLGGAQVLLSHHPVVLIEEKHDDPAWRASALLKQIGMKSVGRWKRDFLFVWPGKSLSTAPDSKGA